VRRLRADELCALLDERLAVHAGEAPVLATDADGTLYRGDVGEAMFETALRERLLRPEALDALAAEALRYGVDPSGDPSALGAKLYDAWRAGHYPDEPAFAMMTWTYAGYAPEELADLARRVLDEFDIATRARPEMMAVLEWGRERALPLYVVSASPIAVVLEATDRLGLGGDRVVAMEPALAGGRLAPRLATPATYAEGKLARLRQRTAAPVLAAFGDSYYDRALLEAAAVPVAVSPSPELVDIIPSIAGCIVLEGG
jgi:phosphatidylglycerophosphatase C